MGTDDLADDVKRLKREVFIWRLFALVAGLAFALKTILEMV